MVYSGFFKRFLALFIDGIILGFVYLILLPLPIINNFIFGLLCLYYHVAFETSDMRGTPGKYYMKISLVNASGDTITTKDSIIRFFISYLSSGFFCLGYMFFFFTEKKQTLHDLVARTFVTTNSIMVEVNPWDVFTNQAQKHFHYIKASLNKN